MGCPHKCRRADQRRLLRALMAAVPESVRKSIRHVVGMQREQIVRRGGGSAFRVGARGHADRFDTLMRNGSMMVFIFFVPSSFDKLRMRGLECLHAELVEG